MKVGVLALQGASRLHAEAFARLGQPTVDVKRAEQLADVDRLVVPGGESTTISMLLERNDLLEPLGARLADGMPVFGTCAGMILLAREVADARPDQHWYGAIDIAVLRNGYGTQIDSFEADLDVAGLDARFRGVFIRAPVVEAVGDDVEVLACNDGRAVLCRQGPVLVSAFHPELAGDDRLHRRFLEMG